MIVQLSLLGLILLNVFHSGSGWLISAICLLMILLAAHEAVRRAGRTYRSIRRDAFLSMLIAAGSSMLFVMLLVVQAEPWWNPRYLIPLLGMVARQRIDQASASGSSAA